MAVLGPFEPAPRLAAGVSGGADSMALALLADAWARERGGSLLALVVDHRLRPESGSEAMAAVARLGALGIATRLLAINGLSRGPALAERARSARSAVLEAACTDAGILHLLLGHHAGDQAETLLIRTLGGSGPAGLAGMATAGGDEAAAVAATAARGAAGAVARDVGGHRRNMDRGPLERRCPSTAAAPASAASRPGWRGFGNRRPGGRRHRIGSAPCRAGPQYRCEPGRACRVAAGGLRRAHRTAACAACVRGAVASGRRGVVSAGRASCRGRRRGAAAGDLGWRPAVAGWPARPGIAGCARGGRDGAAGSGAIRRRMGRAISSRRRGACAAGRNAGCAGRRCGAAAAALATAVRSAAHPAGGQTRRGASRSAASVLS